LVSDLSSTLLAQLLSSPFQELLNPSSIDPKSQKSQEYNKGEDENKGIEFAVLVNDNNFVFVDWIYCYFLLLLQFIGR
jgi:hypothetical protein